MKKQKRKPKNKNKKQTSINLYLKQHLPVDKQDGFVCVGWGVRGVARSQ